MHRVSGLFPSPNAQAHVGPPQGHVGRTPHTPNPAPLSGILPHTLQQYRHQYSTNLEVAVNRGSPTEDSLAQRRDHVPPISRLRSAGSGAAGSIRPAWLRQQQPG